MNILESKPEKLAPRVDIEIVCGCGCQKLSLTLNLTGVSLSLGTGCVPSPLVWLVPCVFWALMGKELPGGRRAGAHLTLFVIQRRH